MHAFDQVLLYNFFEDSKVDYSQWRVLLNSVSGCMAPKFDDGRHGGVCREASITLCSHLTRPNLADDIRRPIPAQTSVRRHHSRAAKPMDHRLFPEGGANQSGCDVHVTKAHGTY